MNKKLERIAVLFPGLLIGLSRAYVLAQESSESLRADEACVADRPNVRQLTVFQASAFLPGR